MKRRALFYLSILAPFAFSNVSCAPQEKKKEEFKPEVINFEKVPTVQSTEFSLLPGSTRTIEVNYDSLDNNYIKLEMSTDVNLYGMINYLNIDNHNETNSESFYVEGKEGNQDVCHFFDAFRPLYNEHTGCSASRGVHAYYGIPMRTKMAKGAFWKRITTITIKNVSDVAGNVHINGLYISDRKLPKEEIYISQGAIKVGVDLMGGGTFTYLERLNYKTTKKTYNIDEILTEENDVYIGVDAFKSAGGDVELGSKDHHVNLINYCDAGRQFQQSFYANVGGSTSSTSGQNGYTRKMCYTATTEGYYWPYNPVQGGDVHCNISQIIDYQRTANSIYVKCKALDWADNNCVTDSYTENWYTIENDVVLVKNRFTNFAGFTNMEECGKAQLELPAAYVVHPLHRYVTYQGETPWINDETGLVYKPNLDNWAKSADITLKHPEDWFAWVNDDNFGVGVYIPDVDFYAAGRSNPSVNVTCSKNIDAFESPMGDSEQLRYNKQECTYFYQSCYVSNTCYTAPEIFTTMLDYIPFEYNYAVSVDYLPVIRSNFYNIYRNEMFDNSTMFAWDNSIKDNAQ